MIFGKGIVKKYSREYNRTLKNGERKTYKTEQIQNEDIYTNGEEVIIIPNNEIEVVINLEEENENLKIANYLHVKEVENLEKMIGGNSALDYEKKIEELKNKINSLNQYNIDNLRKENDSIKDKHSKLIIENENLKTKFINIKTENENLKTKYSSIKEENKNLKTKCTNLKEQQASIKESYNQVSSKYDQLKQENLNTKTSYAEIYEINEGLEKDYDELRLEYNELVDKYNDLEEKIFNLKIQKSRDEYIANKVKYFLKNR